MRRRTSGLHVIANGRAVAMLATMKEPPFVAMTASIASELDAAEGVKLLQAGLSALKHGRKARMRTFFLNSTCDELSWVSKPWRSRRVVRVEDIASISMNQASQIYSSHPHRHCVTLNLRAAYKEGVAKKSSKVASRPMLSVSFVDKSHFDKWSAAFQHLISVQRRLQGIDAHLVGQQVRLLGCGAAQPQLKGMSGLAEAYDFGNATYCVRLDVTGELLALRPQCLEPLLQPPAVADPPACVHGSAGSAKANPAVRNAAVRHAEGSNANAATRPGEGGSTFPRPPAVPASLYSGPRASNETPPAAAPSSSDPSAPPAESAPPAPSMAPSSSSAALNHALDRIFHSPPQPAAPPSTSHARPRRSLRLFRGRRARTVAS